MPDAGKIADNSWVKLSERAAVYVLVAGLAFVGSMISELSDTITDPEVGLVAKVTEVRTVQNKAIVPGLISLRKDLSIVTDNLLNHPRFDKSDAQRMDDQHRSIMDLLDTRVRALEGAGGPP
ncbi:MAG: hypothetical protein ACR2RF_25430 [Geminicoccaceae bacterium]